MALRKRFIHRTNIVAQGDSSIEEQAEQQETVIPEETVELPEVPVPAEEIIEEPPITPSAEESVPPELENEAPIDIPPAQEEIPSIVKKFIHCTVKISTKDNIDKELKYRQETNEYVILSDVIEERLSKFLWALPEIEPELTDTTKAYPRRYRRSPNEKKVGCPASILETTKKNLADELDYRQKHGEPTLNLSEVFESRLIKAQYNEPEVINPEAGEIVESTEINP